MILAISWCIKRTMTTSEIKEVVEKIKKESCEKIQQRNIK